MAILAGIGVSWALVERLQLLKLSEMNLIIPGDTALASCKYSVNQCRDHRIKRVMRKNVDGRTDRRLFSFVYMVDDIYPYLLP